jgi:phospholipase C
LGARRRDRRRRSGAHHTRIPALRIAPRLPKRFVVDSASHDTTSIMATLERGYGLRPLTSRDAAVQDLATVFDRRGGR